MKIVFVVMCERWTGTTYIAEVVEVHNDEEKANRFCHELQGSIPKANVNYYYVSSEFIGE